MSDSIYLAPLAEWVASYTLDSTDEHLQQRLFATVLDWSSALLTGPQHPLYPSYCKALLGERGISGACHVIGQAGGFPVATAAAMNAAVSHFWEVDDAHRQSTSHPGITVIPAVMAMAELYPEIPAERVRGAMVVGYEAVTRIGSFLGSRHYAVSHTTATAGTFGAAAAAGYLLGQDRAGLLSTFGHAGTQACGLWQMLDDGTIDAKAFHAATATRNGLAAARLTQAGIHGAPSILEGPRGMLRAWQLSDCDRQWLTPAADAESMIHDVTIKNWPTCGQMHSTLDCALALHEQGPYPAADIEHITVEVPRACLDIADRIEPETIAAAKFSTRFCVAAVLTGKAPTFRAFTPDLLADEEIQRLAQRVVVTACDAFTSRFPQQRPARVTLRLSDGHEIVEQRSFRQGDPEAESTPASQIARAADVLAMVGLEEKHAAIVDWCSDFVDAGRDSIDIAALYSLVPPDERHFMNES